MFSSIFNDFEVLFKPIVIVLHMNLSVLSKLLGVGAKRSVCHLNITLGATAPPPAPPPPPPQDRRLCFLKLVESGVCVLNSVARMVGHRGIFPTAILSSTKPRYVLIESVGFRPYHSLLSNTPNFKQLYF